MSAGEVNEVFMGSVLQANLGQAPARQAARFAGVPDNVPCTTVNKVCASGMKSVMLGAQSILLGDADVVGLDVGSNSPEGGIFTLRFASRRVSASVGGGGGVLGGMFQLHDPACSAGTA